MVTITALNGRLPDAILTVADTGPRGPQRLRLDAAASVARAHAMGAPHGCLRSGYRTRAEQAIEVARAEAGLTPSAAPVGQSSHGEGLGGDWDSPMREWLRARPSYGWTFPLPAERWHGEYNPADDAHPTAPPPVPITEDEAMELHETLRLIRRSDGAVVAYNTTTGVLRAMTLAAYETLAALAILDAMWFRSGNGNALDSMDPVPFQVLCDALGGIS